MTAMLCDTTQHNFATPVRSYKGGVNITSDSFVSPRSRSCPGHPLRSMIAATQSVRVRAQGEQSPLKTL